LLKERLLKFRILVILIDAYKPTRGKSSRDPDPRSVFDDLKGISPDIYRVVKNIDTSFKIGSNEANCLKHAARIVVESEMKKLRESNSWRTLVQDPPSEAYPIEPCLKEENNQ
jgi:hypothetical protein